MPRQENRVHARDVEVHLRLGHLVLEVGDGTQSLDDEVRPDVLCHVHDELGELDDADVVDVRERFLDHRLSLVEREQRLALLWVAHGGDDDLVEEVCSGFDKLSVSVVEGVERPRVQHRRHGNVSWW